MNSKLVFGLSEQCTLGVSKALDTGLGIDSSQILIYALNLANKGKQI